MSSARLVERIRGRLGQTDPLERAEGKTASVAVILRSEKRKGLKLLLIRRASRTGDPWSGQVALPGGRVEASDGSFAATAAREALEEVGLDLTSRAEFLGYMHPLEPRDRRIVVVPSIFLLNGSSRLVHNREVSSHRWIRIASLISGRNRRQRLLASGSPHLRIPALEFGDYVVWGLTERILTGLAEIAASA